MLISDPILALADPDTCPLHASRGVMEESIARWLTANVSRRKTRGFAFVPGRWPVPIGTVSLRRELAIYQCPEWYDELAPLLRFPAHAPHDAYAALILGPVIPRDVNLIGPILPRAAVTFFGLAIEGEPDEDGTRVFTLSDCLFDVSGTHPDDPDALRWMKAARRWWLAQFKGKPLRGSPNAGRGPILPGVEAWQRAKVAEAEAYQSTAWGQQKLWKYVALHVGLGENELRYLRDKFKREKHKEK